MNPDYSTIFLLAGVIVAAQTVETVTGFGSTVIALALGAQFLPIETLLPALVIIGIGQSAWILLRAWRHADRCLLLTRILPACAAGLVAGRFLSASVGAETLKVFLGGFVAAVASLELSLIHRGVRKPAALPAPAGIALLAGGGFVHGVLASGGPLVVLYAGRTIPEKAAFRATLSVLWLVLNVVLVGTYLVRGELGVESIRLAGWMLVPLAAGIAFGEVLHKRVNESVFKTIVQSLLLATGIWLLI